MKEEARIAEACLLLLSILVPTCMALVFGLFIGRRSVGTTIGFVLGALVAVGMVCAHIIPFEYSVLTTLVYGICCASAGRAGARIDPAPGDYKPKRGAWLPGG